MWLAASNEHFALVALTLTKPTWSRANVFRLFMLMASEINRVRSVRWLPSGRMNAQEISIFLTAYSLLFRSVIVTKALEPSPPRRQDCEEIFKPSTGAGCSGTIASITDGSKRAALELEENCFANPVVDAVDSTDATALVCVTACCFSKRKGNRDTPAARITTVGNQPTAVLRRLVCIRSS